MTRKKIEPAPGWERVTCVIPSDTAELLELAKRLIEEDAVNLHKNPAIRNGQYLAFLLMEFLASRSGAKLTGLAFPDVQEEDAIQNVQPLRMSA